MNTLTQAHLRQTLRYNPRTGSWRWLIPAPGRSTTGVAGSINTQDYRVICIDYVDHFAHRLAFLYVTGLWPEGIVDHRNRHRADNRWSNLRDVTQFENMHNCVVATKNAIVRGVTWDASRMQYKAQLYARGKMRLNERFDCLEEAINARALAVARYHTAA